MQTRYLGVLGLWTALLTFLSLQRLWLRRLLLAQAQANIEAQRPAVVEFEESARFL